MNWIELTWKFIHIKLAFRCITIQNLQTTYVNMFKSKQKHDNFVLLIYLRDFLLINFYSYWQNLFLYDQLVHLSIILLKYLYLLEVYY